MDTFKILVGHTRTHDLKVLEKPTDHVKTERLHGPNIASEMERPAPY